MGARSALGAARGGAVCAWGQYRELYRASSRGIRGRNEGRSGGLNSDGTFYFRNRAILKIAAPFIPAVETDAVPSHLDVNNIMSGYGANTVDQLSADGVVLHRLRHNAVRSEER